MKEIFCFICEKCGAEYKNEVKRIAQGNASACENQKPLYVHRFVVNTSVEIRERNRWLAGRVLSWLWEEKTHLPMYEVEFVVDGEPRGPFVVQAADVRKYFNGLGV